MTLLRSSRWNRFHGRVCSAADLRNRGIRNRNALPGTGDQAPADLENPGPDRVRLTGGETRRPAPDSGHPSAGGPPPGRPARPDQGRTRSSPAGRPPWPPPRPQTRTARIVSNSPCTTATWIGAGQASVVTGVDQPGQPPADLGIDRPRSAQVVRRQPDPPRPACAAWPVPATATATRRSPSTRSRPRPAARRRSPGQRHSRHPGPAPAAHRPARPRHGPHGSTPRRTFAASRFGSPDAAAAR